MSNLSLEKHATLLTALIDYYLVDRKKRAICLAYHIKSYFQPSFIQHICQAINYTYSTTIIYFLTNKQLNLLINSFIYLFNSFNGQIIKLKEKYPSMGIYDPTNVSYFCVSALNGVELFCVYKRNYQKY